MAGGSYRQRRQAAADRDKARSSAGRDIGLAHPDTYNGSRCGCQDCGGLTIRRKARRAKAKRALSTFATSYRPDIFAKPFSKDHKTVLAKVEQAVLRGGLFAVAMPRGSGKTTIAETAVLWALLYGHRRFVVLVGSDRPAACNLLETVKVELETNELLLEDFPEACYPIRCLEGISHRCRGQLFCGARTHIGWMAQQLILPTVTKSDSSGGIVVVRGITGGIRGLKHSRPDGQSLRPDLVILDDPQTDASAKSPLMNNERIKLINGAILGLAGPGEKISGIMPCTVIRQDDLADRALDRKISPEWQGERMKLLYAWPKKMELWDRYAEIRAEGFESGAGADAATEYYRRHRKEMDRGAKVAWRERFEEDEISGLQHAINLWLRNPETFFAEYQNEPIDPLADSGEQMTAEEIARKISGYKRGELPVDVDKVTGFIDLQAKVLYWMICGWSLDGMAGWVLDYGAFPDQGVRYFTLSTLGKTLARKYPGAHLTGRIRRGLTELANELTGRSFVRDDGVDLRMDRLLIDFGWEPEPDLVRNVIRELDFKRATPSKGVGIKAGDRPMEEWAKKKGDLIGPGWRMPKGQRIRHCLFDANQFKTNVQAGLVTFPGDPGCIQLFKDTPHGHRMVAEHIAAEYSVETEGRGRRIREWKLRPGRDNHLGDGLIGCAVGASIEGCRLLPATNTQPAKKASRRAVSYLNV